jgi:hypothetical protein
MNAINLPFNAKYFLIFSMLFFSPAVYAAQTGNPDPYNIFITGVPETVCQGEDFSFTVEAKFVTSTSSPRTINEPVTSSDTNIVSITGGPLTSCPETLTIFGTASKTATGTVTLSCGTKSKKITVLTGVSGKWTVISEPAIVLPKDEVIKYDYSNTLPHSAWQRNAGGNSMRTLIKGELKKNYKVFSYPEEWMPSDIGTPIGQAATTERPLQGMTLGAQISVFGITVYAETVTLKTTVTITQGPEANKRFRAYPVKPGFEIVDHRNWDIETYYGAVLGSRITPKDHTAVNLGNSFIAGEDFHREGACQGVH